MKRFSTHCMDELKDKTKKNRNERKMRRVNRRLTSFLNLRGAIM